MITQSQLAEVLDHVMRHGSQDDEPLRASLRARFPGVHLSLCDDDDMPPRLPCAAENALCRLYYVHSGGHCLSLTRDAASATGLAVARIPHDEA